MEELTWNTRRTAFKRDAISSLSASRDALRREVVYNYPNQVNQVMKTNNVKITILGYHRLKVDKGGAVLRAQGRFVIDDAGGAG